MWKPCAGVLAVTLAVVGAATSVRADATADGRAVSEAFQKAVTAGDVQAVLALYRDDASVIWPGQGEEAHGKAAIEALARRLVASMKGSRIVLRSQTSTSLGDDYIVNVGHWEQTTTSPRGREIVTPVRTSEVLARTGGKWLYLVDHASVGVPVPGSTGRQERGRRAARPRGSSG